MSDNKPFFRSIAKRSAYEMLERQLREAQKRLIKNKYEIHSLAAQQNQLKKDVAALNQCMWEFVEKKKK